MYTYLIGWRLLDVWYYGVRTANKVLPEDDLWVDYFTSSKSVKHFVSVYGDPDVIRIHKRFSNIQEAQSYEVKFLQRVNAKDSIRWLNQNDVHAPPTLVGRKNGFFGKTHSDEQKAKWKVSRKGTIVPDEVKQKLKGRIPWNKGKESSDETKQKMSEARAGKYFGENNNFYGKTHTNESKQKMSDAKKGKLIGPHSSSTVKKISEARKGKRWYKNQEGTECRCLVPGTEPPEWIPGMIKK